jgi:hypothetical protein
MKRNFFSIIAFAILLSSCNNNGTLYEFKKKALQESKTSVRNGNTVYEFAYTDRTSEFVSYGVYATIKPKDTVYQMRESDFFGMWQIVDKELFYKYYENSHE